MSSDNPRLLEAVPNGDLPAGRRLQVYRNLHLAGRAWSLRDPRTGRVVGHASEVFLREAVFRVQPAGRDRARRARQRNVHAYVVGLLTTTPTEAGAVEGTGERPDAGWRNATYRPFVDDGFVDLASGAPVLAAAVVWLGQHGLRYR